MPKMLFLDELFSEMINTGRFTNMYFDTSTVYQFGPLRQKCQIDVASLRCILEYLSMLMLDTT